jgi:hypothetical protein
MEKLNLNLDDKSVEELEEISKALEDLAMLAHWKHMRVSCDYELNKVAAKNFDDSFNERYDQLPDWAKWRD